MTFSNQNFFRRFWFSPWSLLLLILPLFGEYFRGRLAFIPSPYPVEFVNQWYPYIRFISAEWRAGVFPLWSHSLLAGFPLAAFPHAGAFYPPFIFFLLARFTIAFPLFILFHLVLRLIFMYALLREWPVSRFSAWLGAAIYLLSGSSMHLTGHLQMFNTHTWVPGLFWLALRLSRRGGFFNFAGFTAALVMGYLAGDLESLMYSGMVLLLLLVFLERPPWRRLFLAGAGGAAGLLICAAPFLSALNYLRHSYRGGVVEFNPLLTQWDNLLLVGLPWLCFSGLTSIGPRFWMYFGFLVLAGLAAAVRDRASRRLAWLVLAIFIAAMVFWINLWPFSYVFNHLPVLRYTAVDMRFRAMFPLQIALLLLAANGFERLTRGTDRITLYLVSGLILAFIAVQGFVSIVDYRLGGPVPIIISRIVLLVSLAAISVLVFQRVRKTGALVVPPGWLVLVLLLDLFTLSILGVPRSSKEVLQRPVRHPLLEKLAAQDRLYVISNFIDDPLMWRMFRLDEGPGMIGGYLRNGLRRHTELFKVVNQPIPHQFDQRAVRAETIPFFDFLAVRYLLSHQAPFALYDPLPLELVFFKSAYQVQGKYAQPRPPRRGPADDLAPGSLWKLSLPLFQGDELFLSLASAGSAAGLSVSTGTETPAETASFNQALPTEIPQRARLRLPLRSEGEQFLSLRVSPESEARVEITAPELRNPRRPFEKIWDDGHAQLYSSRGALEKYGLYTKVIAVPDDQARSFIFDPRRFDPAHELLVAPPDLPENFPEMDPRERARGDVMATEYRSNRVTLETSLASPAFLSIAESYYPGWRAWVDGQETRVLRADYAYQALPLPRPGPHQIVLKFLPREFSIGLWVSLVSLLFGIFQAARLKLRCSKARS